MLGRLVREPFFHFLLLGGVIYGGVELARAPADHSRITVGKAQVNQLASTYAKQFGVPPTTSELKALVDAYIDEEIFYREGVALKLDEDDEIVRRRVAQKYAFLQQDLAMVEQPSEAELTGFFEQHKADYLIPGQVSFTHVYFSPDGDGADGAKARAVKALEALRAGNPDRAPEVGDRFPDLYDYASVDKTQLDRLFGDTGFADQVLHAPAGTWAGPFRSGYGWHLVRVTSKAAATVPNFDDVKDRVLADYIDQVRSRRQAEALEQLHKKYKIVGDPGQHG
jgi:hypothetical protein